MEEVIKKIIEIEFKAQEVIDKALAEKELDEKQNMDRIKELKVSLINDANHKVDQIREREFLEIKEQEVEKIKKCDEFVIKMEENAESNMDIWVEELVKRVLS